jgi:hypothetical protein
MDAENPNSPRLRFYRSKLRQRSRAGRGKQSFVLGARRGERLYNNLRPASDSEISFSNRFFLVSSRFALITHQVVSLR